MVIEFPGQTVECETAQMWFLLNFVTRNRGEERVKIRNTFLCFLQIQQKDMHFKFNATWKWKYVVVHTENAVNYYHFYVKYV